VLCLYGTRQHGRGASRLRRAQPGTSGKDKGFAEGLAHSLGSDPDLVDLEVHLLPLGGQGDDTLPTGGEESM
jgi:hypothetical protein